MEQKLRSLMLRSLYLLNILALVITTINVNTTCSFYSHQPVPPKSAKQLRKF